FRQIGFIGVVHHDGNPSAIITQKPEGRGGGPDPVCCFGCPGRQYWSVDRCRRGGWGLCLFVDHYQRMAVKLFNNYCRENGFLCVHAATIIGDEPECLFLCSK